MTRRKIVTVALGLALVATTPAAAFAQVGEAPRRPAEGVDVGADVRPVRDLEALKARALEAIDRRLQRIDRLEEAVRSSEHVTPEHRDELLAELDRSAAGLRDLAAQIDAAETAEELRELIPKIATDYRIFVLVTPKVKEVLVADAMVDLADRFDEAAEKIADAIERAAEAGYDVSEAEAALERMVSLIDQAESLAEGVPPSVLPLTPSQWPDPAQGVIREAHDDLVEARSAFRGARQAAHDAVAALRAAIGDDGV